MTSAVAPSKPQAIFSKKILAKAGAFSAKLDHAKAVP
jgi:hypothetical protein